MPAEFIPIQVSVAAAFFSFGFADVAYLALSYDSSGWRNPFMYYPFPTTTAWALVVLSVVVGAVAVRTKRWVLPLIIGFVVRPIFFMELYNEFHESRLYVREPWYMLIDAAMFLNTVLIVIWVLRHRTPKWPWANRRSAT